jgi:hypothetical protein
VSKHWQSSDDALLARRAQFVLWSARGWSVSALVHVLGCCRRTVRRWLHAFLDAGLVGLLGALFFTLARVHNVTPGGSPAQTAAPQTNCAANAITAHLPADVSLHDLAMTSSGDSWAVGGAGGGAPRGVMFHYQQCHWSALPQTYFGVSLNSVSMVSATDGWAVGGTPSRADQPFALHNSGGRWPQVAIPLPSGSGTFITVRMLNADEGWILASTSKLLPFNNVLLHDRNGVWTPVALPFDNITDIAPVGGR